MPRTATSAAGRSSSGDQRTGAGWPNPVGDGVPRSVVAVVTLLTVCVATGLLIAPAAQHRVLFRQQDKEGLLRRSSRMAYAGLVVLAVAITTAVLLVTDVLFSRTHAWISAAAVAAVLAWWWIVVPFWQRSHSRQEDLQDDDEG